MRQTSFDVPVPNPFAGNGKTLGYLTFVITCPLLVINIVYVFFFFLVYLQLEGEAGEPAFRRLVLRLVAHVIRLYSSSLVTESEVPL